MFLFFLFSICFEHMDAWNKFNLGTFLKGRKNKEFLRLIDKSQEC